MTTLVLLRMSATSKQPMNLTFHVLMSSSYTDDIALAKNVAAFTVMADGIPIIYAGQEQHYNGGSDPSNREAVWLSGYNTDSELYKLIAGANAIRSHAIRQDDGYLSYKVLMKKVPTFPLYHFSHIEFPEQSNLQG